MAHLIFSARSIVSWWNILASIVLLGFLLIWGWQLLIQPTPTIPLDFTNDAIHEWTAIFYDVISEVFVAVCQNIVQILIPLLFFVYFLRQGQYTSAAFCLFWTGDNIIQVGVYMADAEKMQLQVCSLWYFTCGPEGHDWHIIFSTWGLLSQSELLGGIVRFLGSICVIASIGGLIYIIGERIYHKLTKTLLPSSEDALLPKQ